MNDKQKQAIRWGIGIGIAMVLIPPWSCPLGVGYKKTVYELILNRIIKPPPEYYIINCQIDTFQLLIQFVVLCIIIGGFVVLWKDGN
jgi:hypothetical protein